MKRKLLSPIALLVTAVTWLLSERSFAAEKYVGICNVVFEGDSTLHSFTGDITNIAVMAVCETNSAGVAVLNSRLEITPK